MGRPHAGRPGQYLGCVWKVENGIVTVYLGVARGTLLGADLYLPKSWVDDRPRCRAPGIPDDVLHRPKWRPAMDQLIHDSYVSRPPAAAGQTHSIV